MGKRDETRALIIEKTAPVFNRRGYSGTSLSDMTAATGLTKGSIYGNFTDKDEVALQAFAYNIRQRKRNILREMRRMGDSPLARLYAYPRVFRRTYNDIFLHGGCPIINTTMDADDTMPALQAASRRVVEEWRAALVDLIKRGVRSGEIQAGVRPARQASLLISLLEGGLWMAKATGKKQDLMHALDHFEELLDGMAAGESSL